MQKKKNKTARFDMVMTHEDKKTLDELALKADMPASQIVRMLIREAAKKVN